MIAARDSLLFVSRGPNLLAYAVGIDLEEGGLGSSHVRLFAWYSSSTTSSLTNQGEQMPIVLVGVLSSSTTTASSGIICLCGSLFIVAVVGLTGHCRSGTGLVVVGYDWMFS